MTVVHQQEGDLEQRYDRTLIRFDGNVYYCRLDHDSMEFCLHRLENTRSCIHRVDPYDERIDTSSVPLGYVNTPDGSIYVTRNPERQWKQSVPIDHLDSFLGSHTYTLATQNTLDGVFPSVNEALNMILDGGFPSVAVSRDVKLEKSPEGSGFVEVLFRNKGVGTIENPREDMTIVFYDEKSVCAMRPHIEGLVWRLENEQDCL